MEALVPPADVDSVPAHAHLWLKAEEQADWVTFKTQVGARWRAAAAAAARCCPLWHVRSVLMSHHPPCCTYVGHAYINHTCSARVPALALGLLCCCRRCAVHRPLGPSAGCKRRSTLDVHASCGPAVHPQQGCAQQMCEPPVAQSARRSTSPTPAQVPALVLGSFVAFNVLSALSIRIINRKKTIKAASNCALLQHG